MAVLGFSRGRNQSYDHQPFDRVAFHGMRPDLAKILRRLGLLGADEAIDPKLRAGEQDFAFTSLIRCSIAKWDAGKSQYAKSGNAILTSCLKDPASRQVATTCTGSPHETEKIVRQGAPSTRSEHRH